MNRETPPSVKLAVTILVGLLVMFVVLFLVATLGIGEGGRPVTTSATPHLTT